MKLTNSFLSLGAAATLSLFVVAGCAKKTASYENTTSSSTNSSNGGANTNSSSGTAASVNKGTSNENDKATGPIIKSTTLAGFLPNIAGYDRKNPENTDINMSGMAYAVAKSDYTSGDNKITVSIIDYNHQMGMAAAYSMFLNGYNVETNEEVTRSEKIGGYPGWIDWKKNNNSGTVGVFVNDRVFVIVEASKAASLDDLKSIAEKVDLSGIAKASS